MANPPVLNKQNKFFPGAESQLVVSGAWTTANPDNLVEERIIDLTELSPVPLGLKINSIDLQMNGTLTLDFKFNNPNNVHQLVDSFKNNVAQAIQTKRHYRDVISPRGMRITDCEGAWVASSNVTYNKDNAIYVTGNSSAKFTIVDGFTTGLIGYQFLQVPQDLSRYSRFSATIRSSVALNADDLSLLICDSKDGTGGINVKMPVILAVNTWSKGIQKTSSDAGNRATAYSVGIYANRDFGAADIWVDNVWAYKADDDLNDADSLILTSTAAGSGESFTAVINYEAINSVAQ